MCPDFTYARWRRRCFVRSESRSRCRRVVRVLTVTPCESRPQTEEVVGENCFTRWVTLSPKSQCQSPTCTSAHSRREEESDGVASGTAHGSALFSPGWPRLGGKQGRASAAGARRYSRRTKLADARSTLPRTTQKAGQHLVSSLPYLPTTCRRSVGESEAEVSGALVPCSAWSDATEQANDLCTILPACFALLPSWRVLFMHA